MCNDMLQGKDGKCAVIIFLPRLLSETFLDPLEKEDYDLSSWDLREIRRRKYIISTASAMQCWLKKY